MGVSFRSKLGRELVNILTYDTTNGKVIITVDIIEIRPSIQLSMLNGITRNMSQQDMVILK